MPRIPRSTVLLFLGSTVFLSFLALHPAAAASPSYTAGVKPGDWWTLGNFQGGCQAPCSEDFQSALAISEATAIVIGQPNATSVVVRNTVAFNNDTINTYTTKGDLSSGTGNLSFVSSILIAGGLVQGNPIYIGGPAINATTISAYAGGNRTVNVLNDAQAQQSFLWDRATGVLVSYLLNRTSAHISYQLTGTNLWHYRIAIVDGTCQPYSPVSCGTNPIQATVIAGTTVGFNDTGPGGHTIYSCTPDNHPPLSPQACTSYNYPTTAPSFASPGIAPGKVWNLTLPTPGEYYYYDSLDTNRKGLITVLGNATGPPDFKLTANPNPVMIPQGKYVAVTLSASPLNGYTGTVSWGSNFPTGQNYPYITTPLSGSPNFYGGCCGAGISFAVYTSFNTPQGIYNATLTGTGNGLTRSVVLEIVVGSPTKSFYLTGNSTIDMVPGQAKYATIEVHSLAGFNSPVYLDSNAYSTGAIFSINPSIVTPPPDGVASATVTITASAPGNFTITVQAGNQTLNFNSVIVISVFVHPPVGLILYKLFYYGALYPGSSLLLVNSFTDIGNSPDQILSGTLAIDFGTYQFIVRPTMILQPGQSATYNLTITIPLTAIPGTHHVTATITWLAELGIFWEEAPPLVLQGQLPVRASPPFSIPGIDPSSATTTLVNMAQFAKNYGLLTIAIYVPTIIALTSTFVIREQRRRNRHSIAVG